MAPSKRKRRAPSSPAGARKRGRTAEAGEPIAPDTPKGAKAQAPDQDWFDARDAAKVRTVKAALHVSNTAAVDLPLCREREVEQLQPAVWQAMLSSQGGFCYIAGTPGIGKTMTVRAVVLREFARLAKDRQAAHVTLPGLISVNCMSTDGGSVMGRLVAGMEHVNRRSAAQAKAQPLHQPVGASSCKDAERRLRELLADTKVRAGTARHRKGATQPGLWIVILDELDGLLERAADLRELGRLLALARQPGSRLLLLGISNSLDLIVRRLADLDIKVGDPHKVDFKPYSRQQLGAILRQRLAQLPGPVFEPHAVTLCAAKMASANGDVRQVLSACEAALNVLVDDVASAEPTAGSGQPPARQRLVGPDEVSRAVASLMGGSGASGSETAQAIRALPAEQKVALIAAYQFIGDESEAATTSGSDSNNSAATDFFLRREDSNDSFSSPPAARRTNAGGSKRVGGRQPAGGGGRACAAVRRDCKLGALHRHYQALCKQMVHRDFQTLSFGEFQCTVTDLMTRVLAYRPAKNKADSVVTLLASGADINAALGDSHVFRQLLSGGR